MKTPYDLIDVEWDKEDLRARPINWNVDLTDEGLSEKEIGEAIPTEYELCCPNCGARCVFGTNDPQIECECGSSALNPLCAQEHESENEEQDVQEENIQEEDIQEEDVQEEQIIQEPKCADNDQNDVFDSLIQSISDSEVDLDQIEPDNNEQNLPEHKLEKSSKKKAKKKRTRRKKKRTRKKKKKKSKSNE